MWHASIARHPMRLVVADPAEHIIRVERALRGVGSAKLGEWLQIGDRAVHLRRRLTPWEADHWSVTVADVRGTPEGTARFDAVRPYLPPGVPAE